jgi:hypothetical protein
MGAGGGSAVSKVGPVFTLGLGGEIASLEDRASPVTMRESQAAWVAGDGLDGECWWQGGAPGDSKHFTKHCALDTAVEAAQITRKSTTPLMTSFFHYITPPARNELALNPACR